MTPHYHPNAPRRGLFRHMRERVRDWLQWFVIVVVLLIDQVLLGMLGNAVMQAWYLVSEKVAIESRRRL